MNFQNSLTNKSNRSTKKKSKSRLNTMFKTSTDEQIEPERIIFKNSNSKQDKFKKNDDSWKERTLKRNKLFTDSQNSISSINDSNQSHNNTNISSMALLNLDKDLENLKSTLGISEYNQHNSYVKYQSINSTDICQKHSPRLHEVRKISKMSKNSQQFANHDYQDTINSNKSLASQESKHWLWFHDKKKQSIGENTTKDHTIDDSINYNTDKPHDKSPVRTKHPFEEPLLGDPFSKLKKLMSVEQQQNKPAQNKELTQGVTWQEIEAERLEIVKMLEGVIQDKTTSDNISSTEFMSAEQIFKKYGKQNTHSIVRLILKS